MARNPIQPGEHALEYIDRAIRDGFAIEEHPLSPMPSRPIMRWHEIAYERGATMSMSDCAKCWDTPCTCGWEYRTRSREARIKLAAVVLGVKPEALASIDVPERHPMDDRDTQSR